MKSDCDKWFHYTYDNITSNFSCLLFMETKDGGGKPNQMKCQSNLIWPNIYCHSLSQCRDVNMYVLLECRGPWEPLSSHRDLSLSGMSPVLSTLTSFCLRCYFFFHAWLFESLYTHTPLPGGIPELTTASYLSTVFISIGFSLQLDRKCHEGRRCICFCSPLYPSSWFYVNAEYC